jgi:hypothetical protein
MDVGAIIITGTPIPSTSPVFLAVVGVHVLGLVCTQALVADADLSKPRLGWV